MPQIIVLPHKELCPDGAVLEAEIGASLCETLIDNDIAIEHACEMSCACTTCHVIVREGFNSLNRSTDDEEDLLDAAWGLESTSRLSCQVKISEENITIEIPKYTINHARENH
jgi:2Fe-2S ferredoxin